MLIVAVVLELAMLNADPTPEAGRMVMVLVPLEPETMPNVSGNVSPPTV